MKNKLIPNNYLFHFEEIEKQKYQQIIEKEEFKNNSQVKVCEKLGESEQEVEYIYKNFPHISEQNNLVPIDKLISNKVNTCFKNIKSYEIDIEKYGFVKTEFCETIYLKQIGREFYKIRIEHIYAFNNTDPTGPKVQQPINQIDDPSNYILDNFRKITPEEFIAANNNVYSSYLENKTKKGFFPVVAILDTGIDLGAFKTNFRNNKKVPLHYYKNPCKSDDSNCCCSNQNDYVIGHNFYNKDEYGEFPNHPYDNDGFTKHGTRVAKLIAKITDNRVRIMTLKTANHKGQHELFDIYCAFEYILKYNAKAEESDKVKIINASWAFKSDYHPIIFEYYLRKLKVGGVIFVTTAGNEHFNVEDINLYPALLNDSNNFFVVTDDSGSHGKSSLGIVNACVNSNMGVFFKDVLKVDDVNNLDKLFGTSFAAAIYSGYLIKSNFGPGTMVGEVSTLYPSDYPY